MASFEVSTKDIWSKAKKLNLHFILQRVKLAVGWLYKRSKSVVTICRDAQGVEAIDAA